MRYRALGIVLTLALLGGCGGDSAPPASASTSEISQGLLSSVQEAPERGRQVPSAEGLAGPDSIEVDVNLLGYDRGEPGAPVQIVEMSDYGCGYCRQFHEQTWPVVQERFIETGKVHWKFLPFITGMFDNSLAATEGAECALAQGPEAFRALNDILWDEQGSWKRAGDPQPVVREMAGRAGVDLAAWDACMSSNERVVRIRAATALAQDLNVRGTPTFFVMGYPPLQGALPTETFVQVLDMLYQEAMGEDAGDDR